MVLSSATLSDVKEKTSLAGGFRIPEEHLKKRVNPSDSQPISSSPSQYRPQSSFSFNPHNTGKKTTDHHNSQSFKFKVRYDPNAHLTENLVKNLEFEVEKLKKESEEFKLSRGIRNACTKQETFVKENKVMTEYLSSNIERVQAIKHVSTSLKPEYMSLEEVQRLKEEHHRKLLEIENFYYEKKKKNDYSINKYDKIKDDFDLSEFDNLDDQANYNNEGIFNFFN